VVQPQPAAAPAPVVPTAGYQPPGQPVIVGHPRTNGFAIASLVLGIFWLYGIGSILALVFGYKAKGEVDRSGGRQTGRGLAIAGIVLGWIGVALLVVVIIAFISYVNAPQF
jgi:Domain of unknown function (DUF4190)